MKLKTQNIPSSEVKSYCKANKIEIVRYVGRFGKGLLPKDATNDKVLLDAMASDILVYLIADKLTIADAQGTLCYRDLNDYIDRSSGKTATEHVQLELAKKDVANSWE